ncbi:ABC transporter permease [Paractinoplanes durhamensis]|uniref:ABC transporter permease n=1 Tax=Paractinoplanes durhamensis TaxID=113563 RepID=UPI003638AF02
MSVTKLTSGRQPAKTGEITVTPRTADRLSLKVGGTTKVAFRYDDKGKPLDPATLTVVGIVEGPEDYGFQAYAPQAAVSALTGEDYLQRIDVRLGSGADADGVRNQIASIVAAGTAAVKDGTQPQVATGSEIRLAEARDKAAQVDDVFKVIFVFVAVAVVAAGLVAASTFRIVFAQRMRQLALLRAVGAGRGGVSLSLAVEGALTGLATGTVGVLLALGAGHLVPALARAFGPQIASPGFPLQPALLTIALAVVITMVAVVAPAFTAGRVSPSKRCAAPAPPAPAPTSASCAGRPGCCSPWWPGCSPPTSRPTCPAATRRTTTPPRTCWPWSPPAGSPSWP